MNHVSPYLPGAARAGTAGLDRNASSVSPPTPAEGQKSRRRSYWLRDRAGAILKNWRVARCGCRPYQGHVDLKLHAGKGFYAGIETCGSVWTCAVCGGKVAEVRRQEVVTVCEKHLEAGGTVYMATLTVRHSVADRCADLRPKVAAAWRRVLAGAPWTRRRQRHGVRGYVRALEVTHGQNGWHPHLHVLFFMDDGEADDFGEWLYDRWAACSEKAGLGACSPDAFKFEKCYRVSQAGDYVTKWSSASEITKSHLKDGRAGGRSPWQLIEAAAKGDKRATGLFREYAEAFKGARQLTWSHGLKDWAGIGDDPDDAVAAREAEGASEDVCRFPNRVWREICRRGLRAQVLDMAETGGRSAVILYLNSMGVRYDGTAPPEKPVAGRARQHDWLPTVWQRYLANARREKGHDGNAEHACGSGPAFGGGRGHGVFGA